MRNLIFWAAPFCLILWMGCQSQPTPTARYAVVVVGGGTGGTAAAIQAARSGVNTLLVESTPWLGGMLTSAGVSATDGNHWMPAGFWGEFRDKLRNRYGGANRLTTGWVSFTQFEPHIGNAIFKEIAEGLQNLTVWRETDLVKLKPAASGWILTLQRNGETQVIAAKILVDGTDLGDVAAMAGAAYQVGMDARSQTGEESAPEQANSVVQNLTYTAILKDYGPETDHTIPQPAGYDPAMFTCACQTADCQGEETHPCDRMINYAKLPNDKYLINWPQHGNDYPVNVVEMSPEEREAAYAKAKNRTLCFVYFLQHELGYKNLGLADDEFDTPDKLPYQPYHREGRRINGVARMSLNEILHPFEQEKKLYRTGIAVGDYPIDLHYAGNAQAPAVKAPPIPSFNVPAGCLIPQEVDNLVVADKAISVTSIVNGTTRVQPVILQIGQAAGLIAALAVKRQTEPRQVSLREVQDSILFYDGLIMPYYDVPVQHLYFQSIQRVGAIGALRGIGQPYEWFNRTLFYPDSLAQNTDLLAGLQDISPGFYAEVRIRPQVLTIESAAGMIWDFGRRMSGKGIDLPCPLFSSNDEMHQWVEARWGEWGLKDYRRDRPITRGETAVMLDQWLDIFHRVYMGWDGTIRM